MNTFESKRRSFNSLSPFISNNFSSPITNFFTTENLANQELDGGQTQKNLNQAINEFYNRNNIFSEKFNSNKLINSGNNQNNLNPFLNKEENESNKYNKKSNFSTFNNINNFNNINLKINNINRANNSSKNYQDVISTLNNHNICNNKNNIGNTEILSDVTNREFTPLLNINEIINTNKIINNPYQITYLEKLSPLPEMVEDKSDNIENSINDFIDFYYTNEKNLNSSIGNNEVLKYHSIENIQNFIEKISKYRRENYNLFKLYCDKYKNLYCDSDLEIKHIILKKIIIDIEKSQNFKDINSNSLNNYFDMENNDSRKSEIMNFGFKDIAQKYYSNIEKTKSVQIPILNSNIMNNLGNTNEFITPRGKFIFF